MGRGLEDGSATTRRNNPTADAGQRMLELNKEKHSGAVAAMSSSPRAPTGASAIKAAGGDTGATDLERKIAATDREIDDLVYELYGITAEEREIVESG